MSKTYYFPIPDLDDETLLRYDEKITKWLLEIKSIYLYHDSILDCKRYLQKYLPVVEERRGNGIYCYEHGLFYGYSLDDVMKRHKNVEVVNLDEMKDFIGAL